MPRIVYVVLSNGGVAGGQKLAVRHVETLVDLGFDAVCYFGVGSTVPRWFDQEVPTEVGTPIRPDDIVVVPEDGPEALATAVKSDGGIVTLCLNPYLFAASTGFEIVRDNPRRLSTIIAGAPRHAALMRRLFPRASVEMVRCFADERRFRPAAKERIGVFVPRKRPLEAAAIRRMHRSLRPDQSIGWLRLENATETQVAAAFGRAALHLSLSRLESVGMTTLEAMASGCVCAGFTGIGGDEYATADNGFWAPEDDCVAAADALAAAIDLLDAGGAPLERMINAGLETARAWSYAVFRHELEEVWSRLAPDARRNSPSR